MNDHNLDDESICRLFLEVLAEDTWTDVSRLSPADIDALLVRNFIGVKTVTDKHGTTRKACLSPLGRSFLDDYYDSHPEGLPQKPEGTSLRSRLVNDLNNIRLGYWTVISETQRHWLQAIGYFNPDTKALTAKGQLRLNELNDARDPAKTRAALQALHDGGWSSVSYDRKNNLRALGYIDHRDEITPTGYEFLHGEDKEQDLTRDEQRLQRELNDISLGRWAAVGTQRRQYLQKFGLVGLSGMALSTKGHSRLGELNRKRDSVGGTVQQSSDMSLLYTHLLALHRKESLKPEFCEMLERYGYAAKTSISPTEWVITWSGIDRLERFDREAGLTTPDIKDKEGTAMATHAYSKDMLVEYANERLNEQRELLNEYNAGLREIASTLLTEVNDGTVDVDSLREELAKREQEFLEEFSGDRHPSDVRKSVTRYENLVRKLEAMWGDEVHLDDNEFQAMRLL